MDKQNDIQARLAAPFSNDDIDWRLQWHNKAQENGIAVPYVTNRAIQSRLDRVFGVGGWKNEFLPWHSDGKKSSQLCGISVFIPERGEWVTKYDGADDSDIEPIKGGLSESMKRAAVQWGIGRYLYDMPTVYVRCEAKGNSAVICKSEYAALDKAHGDFVKRVFGGGTPREAPQTNAPPPRNANTQQQNAPPQNIPQTNTQPPRAPTGVQNGAPPKAPAQKPASGSFLVLKAADLSESNEKYMGLLVRGSDGGEFQVYLRGFDPELVPGAVIKNISMTEQVSRGVVYRILNHYVTDAQAA